VSGGGRGGAPILARVRILAVACLAGCGGMTPVQMTKPGTKLSAFRAYDRVVIRDFAVRQPDAKSSQAARDFADLIATDLVEQGIFESVQRSDRAETGSLAVEGSLTRYEKGSSTARLWIGFGAGTAHFDAVVEFRDGGDGRLLGTLEIDRNSWPLGGWLASQQDAGSFMSAAALRIARDLCVGKTGDAARCAR
jgi:Domain of unknown function (DUF4410)